MLISCQPGSERERKGQGPTVSSTGKSSNDQTSSKSHFLKVPKAPLLWALGDTYPNLSTDGMDFIFHESWRTEDVAGCGIRMMSWFSSCHGAFEDAVRNIRTGRVQCLETNFACVCICRSVHLCVWW